MKMNTGTRSAAGGGTTAFIAKLPTSQRKSSTHVFVLGIY